MTQKPFAIAAAAATFVLLLVGGLVHATGSSLACPDWPLCFGQVFPKMEGGVLVEHSHRLLASAVGMLTIILAVMIWRNPAATSRLRRLGIWAVALVCFQGLLGGITVLLKLPLLVSTAHLATSMLFFAVILRIVFESYLTEARTPSVPREISDLGGWTLAGAGIVYFQIVLGAFVRHAGAGLACNTTILTCNGELWPTGLDSGPAILHMLHRIGALITTVAVSGIALAVRRRAVVAHRETLAAWAMTGPALVLAQAGLGIATVKSFVNIPVVVAHLGLGALLLAQQLGLHFACRRQSGADDIGIGTAVSSALPLGPEAEPLR